MKEIICQIFLFCNISFAIFLCIYFLFRHTHCNINKKYCIVRTYSAGVFAGYVESRNGKEVVIRNVRRIWYWDGACSLSQLAKDGTAKPENCKFAVEVDRILVTEAIEIIDCTEKARESIQGVTEWKI